MISAMLQYIQRSPDCFHAVEELRQRLLREGYTELRPGRWQLTAGGKYFTTKNGSSMMAFRLPQEAPAGFLLTASHSDSPCFRLRDHAELTGEYIRLSASSNYHITTEGRNFDFWMIGGSIAILGPNSK